MPLITATEVTDALVDRLKAAGFDINLETVTSAEVLDLLRQAQITKPRRFFRLLNGPAAEPFNSALARRSIVCDNPNVLVVVTGEKRFLADVDNTAQFVVEACNALIKAGRR